jgi:tetratricopeptide (TPR) repeat protein
MRPLRTSLPLLLLAGLAAPAFAQAPEPEPASGPPAATPPDATPRAAAPAAPAVEQAAGGPSAPEPEAGAPGGNLTVTPSEPASPADPKVAQARKHFRQGVAFASAGNCRAAIVEFEAAYGLVPRPNALYNIAQCQERLFRYDLAIASYERYLEQAPQDAPDRPAVEAALKALGNLLGTVRIASNVEAEVWADDRLIGSAPGDVFIPAGSHALELRAEGYIPARAEVRLLGGQTVELSLALAKAQTTIEVTETTGLPPTVFWVGVGASVTTAAVGTIFALQVKSLRDEALELDPFDPAREGKRADAEDAELLADVFFGAAGVLGIATTVVAFVTDWDGEGENRAGDGADGDADGSETGDRVRLTPVAAPGYLGLQLGGAL